MATIPGSVKEVMRKTPIRNRRSADADRLSPVAALVRRHDRDRFQTVLFAPAAAREGVFALYASNYELAQGRCACRRRLCARWHLTCDAVPGARGPLFHPGRNRVANRSRPRGFSRGTQPPLLATC